MASFFLGVLVILLPLIVAFVALYNKLKAAKDTYYSATADGVLTDEEKIKFADAMVAAIQDAKTVWTFIWKLVLLFRELKNRKR